ncbi:hypothetical protein Fmac_015273 [Flemingia macrophylla]|uniref:Uncharacterized protein n=1 Tax=Flemingia macrophylla TaxID=520843 RepID=A0ABD1ME39_9FABA
MTTILVSVLLRSKGMSILRPMLQTPITDHHSSRGKTLDKEDGSQLLALASVARVCDILFSMTTILASVLDRSNLEWMNIQRLMLQTPIADDHSRVHDMATNTSTETRKLEGELDALVNVVTQLAANHKPASVARNCGIRSSNNHYTSLAANQKPATVARVCNIRSSNNHHSSVCPSSQQSGVDEHPESYAANTYTRLAQGVHDVATDTYAETRKLEGKLNAHVNLQFSARNDTIAIRGVHDVATDTYAETRKLEGKLDAHVNLVTQLVANQKPASVARVWGIRSSNDHHTSAYTSADTRKLEGKLDALVILVIQLAANQKPAFVARVCDIRSSNDHHTSKLEGKLDALVNLVSQLLANQKPTSVARVCDIRSSNDYHTSTTTALETRHLVEKTTPNSWQFSARNDAIVIRGVHDVATDTSAKGRKLEGKLDALVNLVTHLAANQKPASVARACDIRSSNYHHTSVRPSSQQSVVVEHPEAYAETPIAEHHSFRDKTLDREDGSQPLAV